MSLGFERETIGSSSGKESSLVHLRKYPTETHWRPFASKDIDKTTTSTDFLRIPAKVVTVEELKKQPPDEDEFVVGASSRLFLVTSFSSLKPSQCRSSSSSSSSSDDDDDVPIGHYIPEIFYPHIPGSSSRAKIIFSASEEEEEGPFYIHITIRDAIVAGEELIAAYNVPDEIYKMDWWIQRHQKRVLHEKQTQFPQNYLSVPFSHVNATPKATDAYLRKFDQIDRYANGKKKKPRKGSEETESDEEEEDGSPTQFAGGTFACSYPTIANTDTDANGDFLHSQDACLHPPAAWPVHDKNLEIRPCERVGSGHYGLFSRGLFVKDDLIGIYSGRMLKRCKRNNESHASNAYLADVFGTVVDAEKEHTCYARYANDASSPEGNNAYFDVLTEGTEITLHDGTKQTLTDDALGLFCGSDLIEPRTEITASYGQKYWAAQQKQQK